MILITASLASIFTESKTESETMSRILKLLSKQTVFKMFTSQDEDPESTFVSYRKSFSLEEGLSGMQ